MNYYNDVQQAKQRMKQLMTEAAVERTLPKQPRVTDHVLAVVGTWMINTGERLTHLSTVQTDGKKLNLIETANG